MGGRHRTPRVFESGAQKRKSAAEREKKQQESISKIQKISSFFTNINVSGKASSSNASETEFKDSAGKTEASVLTKERNTVSAVYQTEHTEKKLQMVLADLIMILYFGQNCLHKKL
jgi:hypothetical protein